MNRRTLLAAVPAAATPVVGCLDDGSGGGEAGSDDAVTPSSDDDAEPDDGCGPAAQSLSDLLTRETGDPADCPDSASTSFALENERDESLEVSVDVEGEDALAGTYALEPGERVVEGSALEPAAEVAGTVTVDGEETAVSWPDRSCYRHGIALTPDGVENGWVEPLQGPGDTQHDCYAGDDALLRVGSVGESRTVAVTVVDRCAGTEVTETFEVDADGSEQARGLLTNGGAYDLEIDVEEGESATHEFADDCWGAVIGVEADGEVRVHGVEID